MPDQDLIMERLEDQANWYDGKSVKYQKIFKRIKAVEIVSATLIPLLAGLSLLKSPWSGLITGALGALVTVLEGFLNLGQYQQNWISYRATCEALKHEKFLYLAQAGPYTAAATANAHALLAERVESVLSQENAKWLTVQQQQLRAPGASQAEQQQQQEAKTGEGQGG